MDADMNLLLLGGGATGTKSSFVSYLLTGSMITEYYCNVEETCKWDCRSQNVSVQIAGLFNCITHFSFRFSFIFFPQQMFQEWTTASEHVCITSGQQMQSF